MYIVTMQPRNVRHFLREGAKLSKKGAWGSSGTGLGLPITKALAEANHARFHITSHVDDGTLVEVAFPTTRVLAQ